MIHVVATFDIATPLVYGNSNNYHVDESIAFRAVATESIWLVQVQLPHLNYGCTLVLLQQ
jgi:hypothetical protein